MVGGDQTQVVPETSSGETIFRMLTGYWITQCLYVVAKLRVADLLAEGPRTCAELARVAGAHERSLYRLLRALASLGVFREVGEGQFGLTPLAQHLRSDSKASLCSAAMMYAEELYQAWGALLRTVQTGEPAFHEVFGVDPFDYYNSHPAALETFNQAMGELGRTMYPNEALVHAYDFSRNNVIVDVGGGHGAFLADVLAANPRLSAVLLDLPQVVDGARRYLQERGLADRYTLVEGDFFTAVPGGGDIYILKRIIHDWDDRHATTILANCRQAMAASARLLIIEAVIPPGNDPFLGKLVDLHMMVGYGGEERTGAEYANLLGRVGLRLSRVIPTSCILSIIECAPR